MNEFEVTISYNEPRIAKVEITASDDVDAEDKALKQFETDYPEATDVEVEDVVEID